MHAEGFCARACLSCNEAHACAKPSIKPKIMLCSIVPSAVVFRDQASCIHEMCDPEHRYELEKELMEGSVKVDDLPRIWNERMTAYLGCTPKNDAQGVLQASSIPRLQSLFADSEGRHKDGSEGWAQPWQHHACQSAMHKG